jgi:isoleucyl-tRNA synthetase
MLDFKKIEEEILKFWKEKQIYEKSIKKNSKGKKFYMMDGPPYATGHIHMGTALNKISKDIAMRAQRLQGRDVFDRPGYDTHGVPIEFQIEKEIGSKSKQDIEKFGVKKFIDKCKEFATKYIDVMNKEFMNLGVWMNWTSPYLTLSDEYVETIWDTFKVANEKGLLYLGKYPVHVCPRCSTAVAFNEIEYTQLEDTSVYVKFPLKDKKNTYLLIWTTTPWTLPANTGVMVHPDFTYQEIELSSGEKWIMAKELVPKIMACLEMGYSVKSEFNGKKMENWKYTNPLSKNLKLKTKDAYRVVLSGRYVNLEDGTGLVHSAPGHGKEDYEVGKEAGLDVISPVDIYGNLTEETGKYAGKKARVVDAEIIADLEKDNSLVYKVKYTHDYPLCWRCKSPLLMIAMPQWFFKISDIQADLIRENEKNNWIPGWAKLRMKAWLEGLSDWPVSRRRYWGTPLPIWTCDKCEKKEVIGGVQELKKISGLKKIGVHKPEIDEIKWKCKCGGNFKRVEDVLDVWFDSGVSSWAALSKEEFKKYWPADLNLEGKDQIRGWWNSEMILSQIRWGKKPFDAILMHGMVLDLGKKKMSKSLGNIISPENIIEKYGRDYMRYYFAKLSKGEDFAFDEEEFKDIATTFTTLLNVNNFVNQLDKSKAKINVEDKWIISKFNSLIKEVTSSYNAYKFYEGVQALEKFIVFDLSRKYIKIIRDRSDEVYPVLNEIRIGLLKLLAPICPFFTESIWQELRKNKSTKEESIHLSLLPEFDEKKIDTELEKEFEIVMKIIESGLFARDKAQIGLKWPLAKAEVEIRGKDNVKISKGVQEIIMNQLNIKKLEISFSQKENLEISVILDTKLTPELEAEGFAREISRKVQALRKEKGLVKDNLIDLLVVFKDEQLKELVEKQKDMIKERTNSKKIGLTTEKIAKKYEAELIDKIKDKEINIYFNKTS